MASSGTGFGPFELDLTSFSMLRDGAPVAIGQRAYRMLARNAGPAERRLPGDRAV